MKLSVVIPNYNGAALLNKNLPRVVVALEAFDKTRKEFEIIIVDDFSQDDSSLELQALSQKYRKAEINFSFEINKRNYGFSTTVNRGVSKAKGEIVLLLNSDVIPSENFITPLIGYFKNDQVFAVGCLDESIEKGIKVPRGRGKGTWKHGFLVHAAAPIRQGNSLWASGGSCAFNKKLWDRLGGLDELFNPFYWEDIDLSYRARKSGYEVLFEPKSIVIHEHDKGAIKSKYSLYEVKKTAFRNQFIFVWKDSDKKNLFMNFIWLPVHLLRAVLRGDMAFILGFARALFLIPTIYKHRLIQQKLFIKNDNQVTQESNL